MERGGVNSLPRSSKATKAGPWGRLILHPAGNPSYQERGITVLVPQGVQAAETS